MVPNIIHCICDLPKQDFLTFVFVLSFESEHAVANLGGIFWNVVNN